MQEKLHEKEYASTLITKATQDLEAAIVLSKENKSQFENAAFHVQQCVEKAIKAVLVNKEIPFTYVHDLGVFIEKIPRDIKQPPHKYELIALNEYSAIRRYLEGPTPVTKEELSNILDQAKSMLDWAKSIIKL
jgi:HEPN domain-containing protein